MKRNTETDEYRLCSGRKFLAENGVIGIAKNGGRLMVCEGYAGMLPVARWSASEQRELADHMIVLWREYRLAIPGAGEDVG